MDSLAALPAPFLQIGLALGAVLLAALFFVAGRGPRWRRRKANASDGEAPPPYRAYPVLNAAERRLIADLERILPDHFHSRCRILAQVALPEFVHAATRADFFPISRMRVDLLVVDQGFRPVCAIEYQGAGHYGANAATRGRTRVRDFTKRKALRIAGVPLVEIPESYDEALLRARMGDVTGRYQRADDPPARMRRARPAA